jgi:hypothetical protein
LNILELSKNGDIKMKKELAKLANHLDKLGHSDLADRLDMILKSARIVDLTDDDDMPPSTSGNPVPVSEKEAIDDQKKTEVAGGSVDSDEPAQANADNMLEQFKHNKEGSASNRIDAMAKLISKEFSLVTGGNVHRD